MPDRNVIHLGKAKDPGRTKITILPIVAPLANLDVEEEDREDRVFVTVGAGETRITVLCNEGQCVKSWTAIFGWSDLFKIPFECQGEEIYFEGQEILARAVRGSTKIYGNPTDTSSFVNAATDRMAVSIEDILERTIGSGVEYQEIVLSAPTFLHPVLGRSLGNRPHMHLISE